MARNITISESIKEEIARRLAEQESRGYSKLAQGQWYVINGEQVIHAADNRAWSPWHDSDDVISVDDLVFIYGGAEQASADFENSGDADFEVTVDFALSYVPDGYDAEDWAAQREV